MRLDPVSMEVVPDLATAQPEISANKLEFTYSIRPDARWDDGKTCYSGRCSLYIKSNKCPLTDNPMHGQRLKTSWIFVCIRMTRKKLTPDHAP